MASARMGEMVVSKDPHEELVALGLGSCIGLAIVDRTAGVAGLAHIVLPESSDRRNQVGKFADTAVPELIARMREAGAVERRFETAIAGGARMFEMSGGLDIGARNEAAVRSALAGARVPLKAAKTGGTIGRTLMVAVSDLTVTVRAAGERPETLLEGRTPRTTTEAGATR
jgi:chemotaxis protein CheD